MIFPSYTFLFYFLPVVLAVYFLLPQRTRNPWLLIASLVFYAWGAPNFIVFLLVSSLIDYGISLQIVRARGSRKEALLTVSIVVNVGLLAYYKYFNFFVAQAQDLGLLAGFSSKILLPIGISFFTFHKISYVVDVYRGVSAASRNVVDYLLYITFFPQLIAGPIVRYHEIESYLTKRSSRLEDWYQGAIRFCLGLGKKVLLADPAGAIADNVFGLDAEALSTPYAWLGAVAYAVQLFFDFSGYSDMAIGLARIFGFTFPENFNRPYIAKNFTEFWRRWHISLSRWMRDYLYIPLGGNRGSAFQTYRNLWIVFLLSGLWHGANWTFIAWGAYHGFFLILDRLGLGRLTDNLPRALGIACTFPFILFGWVLFRSPTFGQAATYLHAMIVPQGAMPRTVPYGFIISAHGSCMLIIGLLVCFLPYETINAKIPAPSRRVLLDAGAITLFILSLMALTAGRFSPFIYFQF